MSVTFKRILIVAFLVIVAFYPSLFAELITVDDLDMYKWLSASEPSLKDLIFPQVTAGTYYRPLLGVSYLFDKYVWLLDTRLMHVDNILFHLANALLLYYLTYLLLPREEQKESLLPLVVALLFGLHPLTVESVAWISGRTDIMAGTFVLLSAIFLIRFRGTGKLGNLVLALAALIPGLLIKETPLAFLLGAIFIISARKAETPDMCPPTSTQDGGMIRCIVSGAVAAVLMIVSYSVWAVFFCAIAYLSYEAFRDRKAGKPFNGRSVLMICIGTVLPIGLFFLIRSLVFTSSISSVGRTINLIVNDLNYACQMFFGAAGFYLRKFFVPFPLNFAIREIDPMYNAVGVVVFFLCLYAIRRRSINSALFLAGVCLFLPALPLSLGTITWTSYAERYVYMSMAFWVLPMALWVGRTVSAAGHRGAARVCAALLILFMAVCTFQRSMLWRTNLGLMRDSVTKSPGFKLIRVDYMIALMGHGDLEAAKEQYRIAQTIPSVGYMESLDLNMAAIHVLEGRLDEAEKLYRKALKKTAGKSAVAYGAYISYLKDRFADARKRNEGSDLPAGMKLADAMEKLYRLNKDPMLLYNTGQLLLSLGDCSAAARSFAESRSAFQNQSSYSRISARLADDLVAGRCRRGHP
jgi:hypothetical protein